MDQPLVVDGLQRLGDGRHHRQRPPDVDPTAAIGQILLHGPAFQQLHHQIGGAVRLEEILDADDLAHLAQAGQRPRLLQEFGEAFGEGFGMLVGEGSDGGAVGKPRDQVGRIIFLDRHLHPQPVVPAQIGGAEPALPQHPACAVTAMQKRAGRQMHPRPVVRLRRKAAAGAGTGPHPGGMAVRAQLFRSRPGGRGRQRAGRNGIHRCQRCGGHGGDGRGGRIADGIDAARTRLTRRRHRHCHRHRHRHLPWHRHRGRSGHGGNLAQTVEQMQQPAHLGLGDVAVGLGDLGLELRLADDLQDVLPHQRQGAVLAHQAGTGDLRQPDDAAAQNRLHLLQPGGKLAALHILVDGAFGTGGDPLAVVGRQRGGADGRQRAGEVALQQRRVRRLHQHVLDQHLVADRGVQRGEDLVRMAFSGWGGGDAGEIVDTADQIRLPFAEADDGAAIGADPTLLQPARIAHGQRIRHRGPADQSVAGQQMPGQRLQQFRLLIEGAATQGLGRLQPPADAVQNGGLRHGQLALPEQGVQHADASRPHGLHADPAEQHVALGGQQGSGQQVGAEQLRLRGGGGQDIADHPVHHGGQPFVPVPLVQFQQPVQLAAPVPDLHQFQGDRHPQIVAGVAGRRGGSLRQQPVHRPAPARHGGKGGLGGARPGPALIHGAADGLTALHLLLPRRAGLHGGDLADRGLDQRSLFQAGFQRLGEMDQFGGGQAQRVQIWTQHDADHRPRRQRVVIRQDAAQLRLVERSHGGLRRGHRAAER